MSEPAPLHLVIHPPCPGVISTGIDSAVCIWCVAGCQLYAPLEIRSLNHRVLAFAVYLQGVNGFLTYEHKTPCRCESPVFRDSAMSSERVSWRRVGPSWAKASLCIEGFWSARLIGHHVLELQLLGVVHGQPQGLSVAAQAL